MAVFAAGRFNTVLRSFLVAISVCVAFSAQALSVGEITVSSAVGERFYGVAKITGARSTDPSQILVSVAPRSVYQRMGVTWDYFHSRLIFDVLSDENNELYLRIVSSDIVYEPYLDFVIALRWPSGFISKQYTVLMDMPQQIQRASQTAVQRQQQAAEVALPDFDKTPTVAEDVVVSPLPPAVSAPATSTLTTQPTTEAEKPLVVEQKPLADEQKPLAGEKKPLADEQKPLAGEKKPLADEQKPLAEKKALSSDETAASAVKEETAQTQISDPEQAQSKSKQQVQDKEQSAAKIKPVKKPKPTQIKAESGSDEQKIWKVSTQYGDTLWSIARKIKQQSGGNTLDVLNALHENNPRAFINGNIDLLRADAKLSVSLAQIQAGMPESARQEALPVKSQTSNTDKPDTSLKQVNEESPATRTATEQRGVLSLVAEEPDTEVSEAVASLSQSLEESNTAFDEQLEKNKAQTQKIESSMENLLEQYDALSEKTTQLKELEAKLNRSIAEKAQVEMGLAEASDQLMPADKQADASEEDLDATSFVKTLLSWLVAIAVLGALAALVVYAMRRWQYQRWEAEGAHWDNEVFMDGNQFEGDERAAPVELKGESVFIRPAEDPDMASHIDIDLTAADGSVELQAGLYIAYQRYDDAEELLKAALEYQPENLALKVHLLEVYAGLDDNQRFEALASELEALNDPQLNNKIKGLRA